MALLYENYSKLWLILHNMIESVLSWVTFYYFIYFVEHKRGYYFCENYKNLHIWISPVFIWKFYFIRDTNFTLHQIAKANINISKFN